MLIPYTSVRSIYFCKALLAKQRRRKPSDIPINSEINESIRINVDPYKEQDERFISKQYKLRRKADVEKWLLPPQPMDKQPLKTFPIQMPQDNMPITEDIDDPYKICMKQCVICRAGIALDYKNTALLSQFISPQTGLLFSQEITGMCAPMQEKLDNCIQTAQTCGLLPYSYKMDQYLRDPELFNPMRRNNLKNVGKDHEKSIEAAHVPEIDKVNEDRHVTDSPFMRFYD